jgi:hypothetical protein
VRDVRDRRREVLADRRRHVLGHLTHHLAGVHDAFDTAACLRFQQAGRFGQRDRLAAHVGDDLVPEAPVAQLERGQHHEPGGREQQDRPGLGERGAGGGGSQQQQIELGERRLDQASAKHRPNLGILPVAAAVSI